MPNTRLSRLTLVAGAALALWPSLGSAQVINRPERAFRGLFGGNRASDPTRSRTELTFTLNALGGYDDNAAAGDGLGAPGTPTTAASAGYTGTVDAALAYFKGKADKSFNLSFGGGVQAYRDVPLEESQNFVLDTGGTTTLGRRTTVLFNESLRYTTQYHIDSPITGGIPVGDLPTTDSSVFGLGNRTSIDSATTGSLEQRIARDDRVTGTYSFTTTDYTEGDFGGYRAHRATARYAHQVGRWSHVHGEYSYARTRFAFAEGDDGRPMTEQRVIGGFSWEKRLSPRRTFFVSLDAGALNLDSVTGDAVIVPFNRWAPYAALSTQLDIGRDWNLGGNYRRGSETLEGLTIDPFLNDGGAVTLSGLVSRRVELSFIGGYARGTQAAESITATEGRYVTSAFSSQVRVAISRTLSTIVSYHFYHYDFDNTTLPTGVPPEFDRHAVRVGLSVWLPLFGRYDRR